MKMNSRFCSRSGILLLVMVIGAAEGLGVNWGTRASHPLPPSIAVKLLQDNGFSKVKLFDAEEHALRQLAHHDIEVMVGIPNDQLQTMATSSRAAANWVEANITEFYYDVGVKIRYVAVGNEPFLKAYNNSFVQYALPALTNIQNELDKAGLKDIKATMPLNADVYGGDLPSEGDFRMEIKSLMIQICQFLSENGSPFMVNIYPFLSLYSDVNFPLDFAFFDGTSQPVVDGNIQYTNVFDANLDTLVWALKKAGFSNLPIIVGEVGWPTDGDKNAQASYAQRFNQGLLKHIMSGQSTPMKADITETYLFSLVDEDKKSIDPGNFERHWGIFQYDGQPKYELDLSGQGQNRLLVAARGVKYLQRKWCVLNPTVNPADPSLPDGITFACQNADCTSLGYGSTCGNMDASSNASYAFNMYYQAQNHKSESCNFNNLAVQTAQDPSQGTCKFEIQIDVDASKAPAKIHKASSSYIVAVMTIFVACLLWS